MEKVKDRKWHCAKCDKVFTHKQSLNNHKKSCSILPSFKCYICSKVFTRRSGLTKHSIKFNGKCQSKSCKTCGKVFIKKWHLERHIEQIHTDTKAKSFRCKFCEKTYTRSDHFKKHELQCLYFTEANEANPLLLAQNDPNQSALFDNLVQLSLINNIFSHEENEELPTMVSLNENFKDSTIDEECLPDFGPAGDAPIDDPQKSISRNKKSRLAAEVTDIFKDKNLSKDEIAEVLLLSLKKLDLIETMKEYLNPHNQNVEKRGRKVTILKQEKKFGNFIMKMHFNPQILQDQQD